MHLLHLIPLAFAPFLAIAHVGDMTHYAPGLGSCGLISSPNDNVVALSPDLMANGANPNTNPKCGQQIEIQGVAGGQTTLATIVDTCIDCAPDSIDVSPSVWSKVAPSGDGRVGEGEWDGPF